MSNHTEKAKYETLGNTNETIITYFDHKNPFINLPKSKAWVNDDV